MADVRVSVKYNSPGQVELRFEQYQPVISNRYVLTNFVNLEVREPAWRSPQQEAAAFAPAPTTAPRSLG